MQSNIKKNKTKANEKLVWEPKITLKEMACEMMEKDILNISNQ